MSQRIAALALALVSGAGVAALPAQTIREFSATRQTHGETQLRATVDLAAGTLRLGPGQPGALYRMELDYDAERFTPISTYTAATGAIHLGVRRIGSAGLRVSNKRQLEQRATVVFSPDVDLVVEARLEAVNAEMELGDLHLVGARITNGGSRTVVRFSTPNRIRCSTASFRSGAAEFNVYGLGNARCNVVRFEGGIGAATLDFGGTWSTDVALEATMAAGNLTLRLPSRVGVRMTMDNFLALVSPEGFQRDGKAYVTPGYGEAEHHLDIALTTSLGKISIEWIK